MGDRTDQLSWPPVTIRTHTVAGATDPAAIVECPPASDFGTWIDQSCNALGSFAHVQGAILNVFSAQRTDSGLTRTYEGGQTYYDQTSPGFSTMLMTMYAYGQPNIEVQGLVGHVLGHLLWCHQGYWDHSRAADDVMKLYRPLRGITTQNPDEVYAEDYRCLFGPDMARGRHTFAPGLPLPSALVIGWYIRRAKGAIDALKKRGGYTDLKYQVHPAWNGGGYWSWTCNGWYEYTNGDGLVYRLVNNVWVRQG